MTPKLFTADEANRLLPRLEPAMRRLQGAHQQLREHQQVVEQFRGRASRDGGVVPGREVAEAKTEGARLLAEIQEGVQQVESWGCLVKYLDRGLVDFLAHRGPEQVFLCWHLGEAEIRYWHGLQEGFAGRKPLKEDSL